MKDVINTADQPNPENLAEGGGLQNLAQMLTQGYSIAAYVMNQDSKDEVDAFIAANPGQPAPFRSAAIEIDNSVDTIMVRLKEPVSGPDDILAEMTRIGRHLPPVDRSTPDD